MTILNLVVRCGGRNRGVVSVGNDEILPPLFYLRAGARTISMVAAARAGVDRFWLSGAKEEGGFGETTRFGRIARLGQGCFDARASHNATSAQQSNQPVFCFPGPCWPPRGLPIAP
jgi:hypothetical protein